MKIISHRGYWSYFKEKNKMNAFQRSFAGGFGTETDIRDYRGELVISHDIATDTAMALRDFFSLYKGYDTTLPLALNIKSDGLASKLKEYLVEYNISNYFCFDMSIPDMIDYFNNDLNVFFRISEFETESELLSRARGIWLDGLNKDIVTQAHLRKYLDRGLQVGIVSPDLHLRSPAQLWDDMKGYDPEILSSDRLLLCTDYPDKAYEVFYA